MLKLHCHHLQIDIENYLSSTKTEMVDKSAVATEMVDKWLIKPALAAKLVDILLLMDDNEIIRTEDVVKAFGIPPTTAKRYLRQLVEFEYIVAIGGNKNRSFRKQSDTRS